MVSTKQSLIDKIRDIIASRKKSAKRLSSTGFPVGIEAAHFKQKGVSEGFLSLIRTNTGYILSGHYRLDIENTLLVLILPDKSFIVLDQREPLHIFEDGGINKLQNIILTEKPDGRYKFCGIPVHKFNINRVEKIIVEN